MGSIVDRAMTLLARHFFVFLGTIAIFTILPLSLAFSLSVGIDQTAIDTLLTNLAHGSSASVLRDPVLVRLYAVDAALAVAFVLSVFGQIAVAVQVTDVTAGRKPSILTAVGRTLGRVVQVVGLMVIAVLIGAGTMLVVGGGLAAIVGGIAAAFQAGYHSAFGLSVIVTAAIFLVAAAVALALLLVVALSFAFFAAVVERRRVFDALGTGFDRVFAAGEWKRAVLLALVAFCCSCSVEFAGEICRVALGAARIPVVAGFIFVAFGVGATVVSSVFYAAYYSDALQREAGSAQSEST